MKRIIYICFLVLITISLSGCLKNDKMEDINIITTIYPTKYVTERLYGTNSTIKSIYPKSANASTYKVTDKKLKDYSKYDLFVYNGTSRERDYATKMLNYNKNLKIIDASFGLDNNMDSDIWFNPTNILMIGQNIKNELESYMTNNYMKQELNEKYELLKVDITELETELKKTADNSVNNKIIVTDESFNFLKKYGFKVINLTKDGKEKQSNIEKAISLFETKDNEYVFTIEGDNSNKELLDNLKENYNIKVETLRSLETLTEQDEKNNDDYLSLMHINIDKIKKETYK